MRALAAAGLCVLALAACAPSAPKGVDRSALDEAISSAIGDPSTCVMIAERGSGRIVYRYNSNIACARTLPSCEGPAMQTVEGLAKAVAKDGRPRALSCDTLADASRGVGWAAGPLERPELVYAAMMEGDRAFPGRMMAERLVRAFAKVGL